MTFANGPSTLSRTPCSFAYSTTSRRAAGRRSLRFTVLDQLDAQIEAGAAYIANAVVPLGKRLQRLEEGVAEQDAVADGIETIHFVEYGIPDRDRHGIATERVEVLHPVVKRCGDRAGRDDHPERMPVSCRLAHRDDVRVETVSLKGPEDAGPTEPGLHLIGDHESASLPHRVVGSLEDSRFWNHLATTPGQRLCDEAGRFGSVKDPVRQCPVPPPSAIAAELGDPIGIRRREHMYPVGPARAARRIELVRADIDKRRRGAVIAVIETHHVVATGRGACETDCEFVRFAPRVDEERAIEVTGERREETLGIPEDVGVEVARVGVEDEHLVGGRSRTTAWLPWPTWATLLTQSR